jgi:hypothetical protein
MQLLSEASRFPGMLINKLFLGHGLRGSPGFYPVEVAFSQTENNKNSPARDQPVIPHI